MVVMWCIPNSFEQPCSFHHVPICDSRSTYDLVWYLQELYMATNEYSVILERYFQDKRLTYILLNSLLSWKYLRHMVIWPPFLLLVQALQMLDTRIVPNYVHRRNICTYKWRPVVEANQKPRK